LIFWPSFSVERHVDENILTAIVGLDKSKSLGAVEPLHGSGRHICAFLRDNCDVDLAVKPVRFISRLGVKRSRSENCKTPFDRPVVWVAHDECALYGGANACRVHFPPAHAVGYGVTIRNLAAS